LVIVSGLISYWIGGALVSKLHVVGPPSLAISSVGSAAFRAIRVLVPVLYSPQYHFGPDGYASIRYCPFLKRVPPSYASVSPRVVPGMPFTCISFGTIPAGIADAWL
jgi:hypothetical protein